jgi:glycosyltransferase involved in cell wall biosynthesis
MRKIAHLVISNKKYGGGIYGEYISKLDGVETIPLIKKAKKNRFAKLFEYYFNLYRFSKTNQFDIVIRNMDACFFMRKNQKNIVVFHHYDTIAKSKLLNLYQKIIYKNLLSKLNEIDVLVVVSEYWREHFEKQGIQNIQIIYNPFDIALYQQRTDTEKKAFKAKYGLGNRPIVYIGNPQVEKGADKTYAALKHMDIDIVTSGIAHIELPTLHLDLSFYDYITLLQIADVSVLMSMLKEGWNRVALESLLCKTPVIGTGYGGMGELLRESQQTICRDFSKLPELVQNKIQNPYVPKESYAYALSFDVEKFNNSWREILYESYQP